MSAEHVLREVLPWSHTFETKIPGIDQQHKRLVTLLNTMGSKLAQGHDLLEIDKVIEDLHDYTHYHFRSEEKVWEKWFHDDEWATDHQKTHADFVAKVADFRQQKHEGKNKKLYEQVLRFLIYWLAHHILDDDMRMAKVIHLVDGGIGLQEAKTRIQTEMSDSIEVFIDSLLNMYESLTSRTFELEEEKKERAKATEALMLRERQEQEFGNEVINSVPGLVYLYNEQQRLIRWNRRHEEDLGYSDEDLREMSVLDFFNTDQHEKITQALTSLSSGNRVEVEANVRTKEGEEIPFILNGAPFNLGEHTGFLGTGIDITELKRSQEKLIRKTEEIKETLIGTVTAMSRAMEARDPYTAGHQQRVATIAYAIAVEIGLDESRIEGLKLGASIHDIGKLAIPTEMLVKPTQLTQLEYSVLQTHVEAGANILKDVKFPWPVLDIILQHHERLNGSGYPHGLKAEEICLEGRILAVADVFEAMSAHRPYRPSLGIAKAMAELDQNRVKLYDPVVVDALKRLIENDPDRFSPDASVV